MVQAPDPSNPADHERLAAERDEAGRRLAAAQAELERIVAAAESVATDDEHDPEGIGLALERAHLLAAAERARAQLERIEDAEARLAAGEYGRCIACGREIPAARLAARPTATTCVSCAAPPGRRR